MLSLFTTSSRALLAATIALACVPAAASADPTNIAPAQDLRSPDTRDIADGRTYPKTPVVHDRALRSTQVFNDYQRRLVERFKRGSSYDQALRDAREASLREIRAPEPATATGFDWIAAATGAGAALGLILLTTAAVLLVRRRTQHEQPVAVP